MTLGAELILLTIGLLLIFLTAGTLHLIGIVLAVVSAVAALVIALSSRTRV